MKCASYPNLALFTLLVLMNAFPIFNSFCPCLSVADIDNIYLFITFTLFPLLFCFVFIFYFLFFELYSRKKIGFNISRQSFALIIISLTPCSLVWIFFTSIFWSEYIHAMIFVWIFSRHILVWIFSRKHFGLNIFTPYFLVWIFSRQNFVWIFSRQYFGLNIFMP